MNDDEDDSDDVGGDTAAGDAGAGDMLLSDSGHHLPAQVSQVTHE